jgi:hypothetical protein
MKKKEKLKNNITLGCECGNEKSSAKFYGPISPTGNGGVNKLTGTHYCFDTNPSPFGYRDYKCDWDVKDGDVVIAHGHAH